ATGQISNQKGMGGHAIGIQVEGPADSTEGSWLVAFAPQGHAEPTMDDSYPRIKFQHLPVSSEDVVDGLTLRLQQPLAQGIIVVAVFRIVVDGLAVDGDGPRQGGAGPLQVAPGAQGVG